MTEEPQEHQAPEAPQDRAGEQERAASPVRRRRMPPVLWVVLILALGVGGAYATWPQWSPSLTALFDGEKVTLELDPVLTTLTGRVRVVEDRIRAMDDTTDALQDLKAEKQRLNAQVDGLLKRVVELEQAMGAVRKLALANGGASGEVRSSQAGAEVINLTLEEMTGRLAALEENDKALVEKLGRLDRLEESAGERKVVAASLDRITQRVDLLETAERSSPTAYAVIVAVSQLRQALVTAQPFVKEVDALKAVASTHPRVIEAVGELEPYQDKGVTTLATLRRSFDGVAKDVAAARHQGASEDWMERTLDRLKSLVTLRRVDGVSSADPVDGALIKAEAALNTGDLEAAIVALKGLEGAPGKAAQAWVADAAARMTVERTMAGLHVQVVSLLAGGPESPPSQTGN